MAASQIDKVELEIAPADCELDIAFSGDAPPYTSLTAPVDRSFTEKVTAPQTPGNYRCTVTAMVDGAPRVDQKWNVTVAAATTTTTPPTTTTLPATTIAPETTTPGPLPFTGAQTEPLLRAGVAMLLVGATVLLVAGRAESRGRRR